MRVITHVLKSLASGLKYVVRSPSFVIPVILVVVFNSISADAFPGIDTVWKKMLGGSVGQIIAASWSLVSVTTVSLYIILSALAVTLTIYSVQTGFSLYRTGSAHVVTSVGQIRADQALPYFVLHAGVTVIIASVGVLLFLTVISLWGVGEDGRTALAIGLFSLLFPVYYMTLSALAVIICTPGGVRDRLWRLKYLIQGSALSRLVVFYITRIGIETAATLGVASVVAQLGAPHWVLIILVALMLSLPFALVRSAGFALKLDLLKEDPWFRTAFARYYADR